MATKTQQETENIIRTLALMQNSGEPFFTIKDKKSDGLFYAFEGERADVETEFAQSSEPDFLTYCLDNETEITGTDADEERNGYIALTDEEADEKAKENILETAWAFNPSFLSGITGIDQKVFEAIQANGKCEDNNNAVLSTIEDEKDFVNQAISADGRAHFMNTYDGKEDEETVSIDYGNHIVDYTFYIYRIN